MIIGLIVTSVGNSYFAGLTTGVEDEVHRAGYTLLVGYTHDELSRQTRLLNTIIEQSVDGVIIFPTHDTSPESLAWLNVEEVAHVLVARRVEGHVADFVGVDNVRAGTLLADHLVEIGATSFSLLGGPDRSNARAERLEGLCRPSSGEEVLALHSQIGSPSIPDGGTEAVQKLLAMGRLPDAIVAYSDAVAVGILHELRNQGLEPGRDVAVASFDDTVDARWQVPPLTSIRTFPTETGRHAANLLKQRLASARRGSQSLVLDPELSVRASTRGWTKRPRRRTARSRMTTLWS